MADKTRNLLERATELLGKWNDEFTGRIEGVGAPQWLELTTKEFLGLMIEWYRSNPAKEMNDQIPWTEAEHLLMRCVNALRWYGHGDRQCVTEAEELFARRRRENTGECGDPECDCHGESAIRRRLDELERRMTQMDLAMDDVHRELEG